MGSRATVVTLSTYDQVRAGLYSPVLARADDEDREDFCKGNILESAINTLHGSDHRDRRRAETALFSKANRWGLETDEVVAACARSLRRVAGTEELNLIEFVRTIAIINAVRIVGIDVDIDDVESQLELGQLAREFAVGAGIEEQLRPRAEVLREVNEALDIYEEKYFRPSYEARVRRRQLDPDAPATDLIDALIAVSDQLGVGYRQLLSETSFYMAAGSDTTTQSTAALMHYVYENAQSVDEMANDLRNLQLWLHEALRIRSVVPLVLRRAMADVQLADLSIEAGTKIHVDLYAGSVDPAYYGADAREFNPARVLARGVPRFGFAFSGGFHACLGKALAAGSPIDPDDEIDDDHLFGVVTKVASELLKAGFIRDPDRAPSGDPTTLRWSRWVDYPVRYPSARQDSSTTS